MTLENETLKADDNEANTEKTTDTTNVQPTTTFKALPKFLLSSDDELQPEFTHTPRPKQSS